MIVLKGSSIRRRLGVHDLRYLVLKADGGGGPTGGPNVDEYNL